jgi:hypothetical protein
MNIFFIHKTEKMFIKHSFIQLFQHYTSYNSIKNFRKNF